MAVGNVIKTPVLTEMAMGYARSRALGAAARLGVADRIADREKSVEELAAACGANVGALHRLLRALASFGVVVEKVPGRFALTELGRPLRKDVADTEWASVVFWADLLAEHWSFPLALVNRITWPMSFPGIWGGRERIEVGPASRVLGWSPPTPTLQKLWRDPLATIFGDAARSRGR